MHYTTDSPAYSVDSTDSRDNGSNVWKDTAADEVYGSYLPTDHQNDMQLRPTMANRVTFGANGGVGAVHQDIAVGLLEDTADESSGRAAKKEFTGRKRVWPGALLLLMITAAALSAITYYGVQDYNSAQTQQSLTASITTIDQATSKTTSVKICEQPSYEAIDGLIYAVSSNTGAKKKLVVTGVNWSGMENVAGVPHGLATGQSTLDSIASKLSTMGVNAVRLPLNAAMVLSNAAPDVTDFVASKSTSLNVGTYMEMIQVIVQGLGKQQIGVLLDLHKIDPNYTDTTSEPLWYTDAYPLSRIKTMFKTLAANLCNELHYNIIGIDIKNEPVGGCWPEDDTDAYCPSDENWPRAVETLGDAILASCPNWLIAAEGLTANGLTAEINGANVSYSDWFGASLQNASANPIALSTANKLVYAPHFYSPSVYPSSYFFSKQSSSGTTVSVTEYPNTTAGNEKLKAAVTAVLDNAFGATIKATGVATFYGEYGGIYGEAETLPEKTSTRVIEMLVDYALANNMAGGFAWALNPESEYDFNDEYKPDDPYSYGLYTDKKWSAYHSDFAEAISKFEGSGAFPCFSTTVTTTSSGSSSSAGSSATITADSATTTTKNSSTTTAAAATTATTTATTAATASSGSSATAAAVAAV